MTGSSLPDAPDAGAPLPNPVHAPTAVDPVCGMAVAVAAPPGGTHTHVGLTFYFCSDECRTKFASVLGGFPAAKVEVPPTPAAAPAAERNGEAAAEPAPAPAAEVALPVPVPVAVPAPPQPEPVADGDAEVRDLSRRMVVAILLAVPLLVVSVIDLFPDRPLTKSVGAKAVMIVQAVLATPIVLWCGWPLFVRGVAALRGLRLNAALLVSLGIAAAFAYSIAALAAEFAGARPLAIATELPTEHIPETLSDQVTAVKEAFAPDTEGRLLPFFETAAMIVVLSLIGLVMELRARFRTGEAVRKLLRLTPQTARVVRPDGAEADVPLAEVHIGDTVRVKAGDRIPVDGIVKEGTTTVDESMLTGEPLGVGKTEGSKVMAGTRNGVGALLVEAVRVADDTMLAQIIHLVGQAEKSRRPRKNWADKRAAFLIVVMVLVSVFTFVSWMVIKGGVQEGLNYGLACATGVIIIACPAALGLAAPVAHAIGTNRGAGLGVLFRDALALERFGEVDAVVFDKTGTLTEGKPKLSAVIGAVGVGTDEVLAKAAAVERGSEHPLGAMIVWEAFRRKLDIPRAEDVHILPGKGVRGLVNGKQVVVGTARFLRESGVMRDLMESEVHKYRQEGRVVMMVGERDRGIGLIAATDPIRSTSAEGVKKLRDDGLRLVLCTGDNEVTAKAVAHQLGLEDVIADTLPAEKFAVVTRLKKEGRVVAMAGDGINDAPALAAADVGIALGTGTDIAITTAPVTLAKPDLRSIAAARTLSRATLKAIRQNLNIAFAFNVGAIPVAAGVLVPFGGGLISPVWALAAMGLSTAGVVLNSLRLNRKKL